MMKELIAILFLLPALACAQSATSLNTHGATNNTGLDTRTHQMNPTNNGVAIYPNSATLPLNPSENIPFALTVGGDMFGGDLYCLADSNYLGTFPGAWGCIYGKSVNGTRVGPVVYQVNKCINCDGGMGGPGFILWPDRANADTHGNRGYMDIWAWGQNDSGFSNTINFGNRGSDGSPVRRFRILNDGKVNIPGLAGAGNAQVCVSADGSLYRGAPSC